MQFCSSIFQWKESFGLAGLGKVYRNNRVFTIRDTVSIPCVSTFLSVENSTCERQNNGSEDVHVLIPGSFECVTLHGKKDFVDMIKLRRLRWFH